MMKYSWQIIFIFYVNLSSHAAYSFSDDPWVKVGWFRNVVSITFLKSILFKIKKCFIKHVKKYFFIKHLLCEIVIFV
jgi:hypothetical protein